MRKICIYMSTHKCPKEEETEPEKPPDKLTWPWTGDLVIEFVKTDPKDETNKVG